MILGEKTLTWLRKNYQIASLAILAVVFFFVYSWLAFSTPLIFNSPDETANYFFAKNFAQTGELRVFEPLNLSFGNIIHPRSINVANGFLVPGSFLGAILLFGSIAKVFGVGILPYLTPLFSVLAVLFFYGIMKKIFDSRVASISALMLFVQPAFWYYTSRSLFPNALFIDLLIIGFFWLINSKKYSKKDSNKDSNTFKDNSNKVNNGCWQVGLAGLFIGLALAVRSSEVVWIGAVLLALFLIYRKEINWRQVVVFLVAGSLAFIPIFYFNQFLYGSSIAFGYQELSSGAPAVSVSILSGIKKIILPFGFSLSRIWSHLGRYFLQIFWWLSLPAIIGLGLVLWDWKRLSREQKLFLYFYVFIFLFLGAYYGSWSTYDNITPGRVTIGNSHVRYWLPIYILSLPFVSLFVVKFSQLFRKKNLEYVFGAVTIFLIIILSGYSALRGDEESIVAVKKNILDYKLEKQTVLGLTSADSIIITERSDKVFFPERKIIVGFDTNNLMNYLPLLMKQAPVYYYTYAGDGAIDKLKEEKLKPAGLDLELVQVIKDNERLFRLKFIK